MERLPVASTCRDHRPSKLDKSMDHAARIRQRVLALFLPIAAVLYIGAEAKQR
jgi:hypothetical protein